MNLSGSNPSFVFRAGGGGALRPAAAAIAMTMAPSSTPTRRMTARSTPSVHIGLLRFLRFAQAEVERGLLLAMAGAEVLPRPLGSTGEDGIALPLHRRDPFGLVDRRAGPGD